ncbi:hypothetical protein, partial [Luteococcus sp.]|uniref:hypothetical protein n=1 Tax=Luteococcus sp. TaxID=1969402 RepID=UPI003734FD37
MTENGGDFTVDVDGRLFVITQPDPSMRSHDRYGHIRFDPEEFPFRELVGDSLDRVEDRETMDLAWDGRKQRGRQVKAPGSGAKIGGSQWEAVALRRSGGGC